jgi:hypothetical protein
MRRVSISSKNTAPDQWLGENAWQNPPVRGNGPLRRRIFYCLAHPVTSRLIAPEWPPLSGFWSCSGRDKPSPFASKREGKGGRVLAVGGASQPPLTAACLPNGRPPRCGCGLGPQSKSLLGEIIGGQDCGPRFRHCGPSLVTPPRMVRLGATLERFARAAGPVARTLLF